MALGRPRPKIFGPFWRYCYCQCWPLPPKGKVNSVKVGDTVYIFRYFCRWMKPWRLKWIRYGIQPVYTCIPKSTNMQKSWQLLSQNLWSVFILLIAAPRLMTWQWWWREFTLAILTSYLSEMHTTVSRGGAKRLQCEIYLEVNKFLSWWFKTLSFAYLF